jgi:hypothetical protein
MGNAVLELRLDGSLPADCEVEVTINIFGE